MNICVIGTGYVGLVTGVCFAEKGNRVCCMDIDVARIANLKKNILPIFEIGLDAMVESNRAAGRLHFSTDIDEALDGTDLCFLAVGTPPTSEGDPDMTQVFSAIDTIAASKHLPRYVVVKSTVPVGTNRSLQQRMAACIAARGETHGFEVLSNPEFLKEGMAVEDCLHPERVVIGVHSGEAKELMTELYRPFVGEEKILFMAPESAEITKYAANAMLATRISFMNEVARLCDLIGADIASVKKGLASDRRIGPYFLNAGCGYGGSCFPKDVWALRRIGEHHGLEMELIASVEHVNHRQKKLLPSMLRKRFGAELAGSRIAVLGMAFKPHTDDMREAPSISLIEELLAHGAQVSAYDPVAKETAGAALPAGVTFAASVEEVVADADAAVLVTEWPEFLALDWRSLASRMKRKIVFDGRNVYNPERMKAQGFEYYCIGRGYTV